MSDPLSDSEIQAFSDLMEKATWWDGTVSKVRDSDGDCECSVHTNEDGEIICSMNLDNPAYELDAAFIAAARSMAPRLVDDLKEARKTLEHQKELIRQKDKLLYEYKQAIAVMAEALEDIAASHGNDWSVSAQKYWYEIADKALSHESIQRFLAEEK